MAELGKVIKWLEYCRNNAKCNDCESCEYGGYSMVVCENLIDDALELLKEQEAVKPDTDSEGTCSCGICGETVGYYPVGCNTPQKLCKFCPQCGKAVKWE